MTRQQLEALTRLHLGEAINKLEAAGIGCAVVAAPVAGMPSAEGIAVVCGSVKPAEMSRAFRTAVEKIEQGSFFELDPS